MINPFNFWWGWFLFGGVVIIYAVTWIFSEFIVVSSKVIHNDPKRIAIVYESDGDKVFWKRYFLVGTGLLDTEWKLDCDEPNKVAFKIKTLGLSKPILMRWPKTDYIEYPSKNGDKIIVEFGLMAKDKFISLKHKTLTDKIIELSRKLSEKTFDCEKAESRVKERVEEILDQIKKNQPVMVRPSSKR